MVDEVSPKEVFAEFLCVSLENHSSTIAPYSTITSLMHAIALNMQHIITPLGLHHSQPERSLTLSQEVGWELIEIVSRGFWVTNLRNV
jgi:hypothetical protein